uniref:Protein kinase C-binding protein NELL1 n=1 Tax=Anthurium amnicola TaxID=1678845 RepID=A0A1D1YRV0_9ARAE
MANNTEVKRHSLLHQNPKLAEVLSPRVSRVSKPRDKDRDHRQHAVAQDTHGRPLFPPKLPGNYKKLWPNRVSVGGAEELVKHMSNVPGYLQRVERGGNLQERALNFGVLDWRSLEKWTGNHRRVGVDENSADSPASSHASSSFSTFESSSKSCGSSASSSLNPRNPSPCVSLSHHQDSSAGEDHTQMSEEASSCHHLEISSRRCPVKRRLPVSTEQPQCVVRNTTKCEENGSKVSDDEDVSDSVGSSPGASNLHSRSKTSEISLSVKEKAKRLELKSDCRERSKELQPVCPSTPCCTSADCPQDGHLPHNFEGSIQGDGRCSLVSTKNCSTPTEPGHVSFEGALPSEDFEFSPLSPDVPHSCPLPSDIRGSEWSDMKDFSSCRGERSTPSDFIKPLQHPNEVATLSSHGWHEKHDKYAGKLQEGSSITPERCHQSRAKTLTGGSGSLPSSQSHAVLIKGSSLRDTSGWKQSKWDPLHGQSGDQEADIKKSRRSPLRRLLDPLLKPKAFNRSHVAGPTAGSPRQSSCESKLPTQGELTSNGVPKCSSHMTSSSSGGDTVKTFTPSGCMNAEDPSSVREKKHEALTKQALLQLSWKNGLPLLTFSINESDILAAMRRNITCSEEDDVECIYTFYYVHEIKNKTGGWINQGNKGRRKDLVSNPVGQMNVSCLKYPKNCFAVKEFVLFGPELRPTGHGALDHVPNSELAAIVLRVSEENTENYIGNFAHSNNSAGQSKTDSETDQHPTSAARNSRSVQTSEKNVPNMVAILPSEVHSLSDTGKPATLVERWKSGGFCDCGGWDVGCSLTILTNNLQDGCSGGVQSCLVVDGTHRVELFVQGGQERRPVLSMVAFKEGLYTVNFHASIAVLQAFAVCVAILHSRKPRGLYELQNSGLCTAVALKNAPGKRVDPSLQVPPHPPLSPFGRA